MKIGLIYLRFKRNWRAWLRIRFLVLIEPCLLRRLTRKKRVNNVIVSLTSLPVRVTSLEHTLRSIIAGNVLPEMICLYVDQATYDKIATRGTFLLRLVNMEFLKIKIVEDVRSYTKLVFALQEHFQKDIVICDDDVIYPTYWLLDLVEAKRYVVPGTIVCHRAHQVVFKADGCIDSYSKWRKEVKEQRVDMVIFPTGTGGVLYPAGTMPSISYNRVFEKIAPTADDVWFWLSALSNNCRFSLTKKKFRKRAFMEVPNSQISSLWALNVNQNANDNQLYNACQYFVNHGLLAKEYRSWIASREQLKY